MWDPPIKLPSSCQASLWIAENGIRLPDGQGTRAATLQELYDLPLYNSAGTGLTDKMYTFLYDNQNDGTYISVPNNSDIRDAIDKFRGENTASDKVQTIKEMLRTGKRRSNANPGPKTLSGFLRVMVNSGIYFANNHTNDAKEAEVKALLDGTGPYDTPLWDISGVIGGAGNAVRFGDLTMRQLFELPLRKLDASLFRAVRRAKRLSIFWADRKYRDLGDPGGSRTMPLPGSEIKKGGDGNVECCYNGACIRSDYDDDFCDQVEDPPGSGQYTCTALSDPCH